MPSKTRIAARWPEAHPCLFSRNRGSANGTRPLTYYSYRSLLNRWLADCDIRDEHGQPVRPTRANGATPSPAADQS